MATVKLDVGALDKLVGQAAENGLRSALGEYEKILKTDVLDREGTGRKYGDHQASAPGEPPASDLGNLKANTGADMVIRQDGSDVVGSVVANSEYAQALEKGSKHTAKSRTADALFGMHGRYGPARLTALAAEVGTERTAARPFMGVPARDNQKQLIDAFVRGAKK